MELLTIPEAAARLRLSPSKTYLMAQKNLLPVLRLGRSIRIPAELLDEWVEGHISRPPVPRSSKQGVEVMEYGIPIMVPAESEGAGQAHTIDIEPLKDSFGVPFGPV